MTKHKVFISYYHKDDEKYRNKFEDLFGDIFINKSVPYGAINEDVSTEYIKRVIREDYISDSSVVLVLVGPHTNCRKHVDWEISAGLSKNAGLVGLHLPEHSDNKNNEYTPKDMPDRLALNLKSGYASIYDWTENKNSMISIINRAFEKKDKESDKIKNPRNQMKRNRCK